MPRPPSLDAEHGRIDSVELSSVSVLPSRGDLVEHRADPSAWEQRWDAVPRRWRRGVAAGTVLAVVATGVVLGGVQIRGWVLEQRERERIRLTMSIGVWTSSTTPPGGHVSYVMRVRNAGVLPLEVASVQASDDRIELQARDAGGRAVPAGTLTSIPLSVLLTCGPLTTAAGRADLVAEVAVRSPDGTVSAQRPTLQAGLIQDVADTLCSVRPELRGYELSGPIVRTVPAGARTDG